MRTGKKTIVLINPRINIFDVSRIPNANPTTVFSADVDTAKITVLMRPPIKNGSSKKSMKFSNPMNSDVNKLHLVKLKYNEEKVGKRNNIPYIIPAGRKNHVGYGDFLLTTEFVVFEDIFITLKLCFRPIQ